MKFCIHTIFWAFGEKTPSLLFMLRKENLLCVTRIAIFLWWRISELHENILWIHKKCYVASQMKLHFFSIYLVPWHDFLFFQNILRRSMLCPLPVLHAKWWMMLMLCKMMWWCYVMQNDNCAESTHIPAIKHTIFLSQRWLFAVSLP